MVVPVERVWQLPGVPVIDVADIDALARLADHYDRSILHETTGAGPAFWVTDESGQFRYAPGTSPAVNTGASSSAPDPAEERAAQHRVNGRESAPAPGDEVTGASAYNRPRAGERKPDREPELAPEPAPPVEPRIAAGVNAEEPRPVTAVHAVPAESLAVPALAEVAEPFAAPDLADASDSAEEDWRGACEGGGRRSRRARTLGRRDSRLRRPAAGRRATAPWSRPRDSAPPELDGRGWALVRRQHPVAALEAHAAAPNWAIRPAISAPASRKTIAAMPQSTVIVRL